MNPGELTDAAFGPVIVDVSAERVVDYVEGTGDESERWVDVAPPGYASVLLFTVAGDVLWNPAVAEYTRTLLHLDQAFSYGRLPRIGETVTVTGKVPRVRERGGAYFVSFESETTSDDELIVASTSTFLMSAEPAGDAGDDDEEPAARARATNEVPRRLPFTTGELPALAKSASRADLVRYAAATKDFNPIHWDHASARAGGAPGIIVHGLLMMAWMAQAASVVGAESDPIASLKARFRSPLRPAEQASVAAIVADPAAGASEADLALRVTNEATVLVTGSATVRLPEE